MKYEIRMKDKDSHEVKNTSIQELPDEAACQEFINQNPSTFQEFDIEIVDITSQVEQEKLNKDSLKYLAETDWLIIRESETGVACPENIKQARASARLAIIN